MGAFGSETAATKTAVVTAAAVVTFKTAAVQAAAMVTAASLDRRGQKR
jgi:hypothetical protein